MYKNCFKRLLDFSIAFVSLLFVGWLIAIVAIWLHFANKGAGAFFSQERPGKDGKVYKVIKFKTMTDEKDVEGKLLPDAQRLTKIGQIVRSPLLVNYLPLYSPEQMRRHEVRPGISGWAQVNGRNTISFTKQFEYDVFYVDHLSFWLDVKIFFMTVLKVFKREGISEEGQATREPFNGHN